MNRSYAVFGLGHYGQSIAKELVKHGMEVLAVDIDEDVVNDASADIPLCKCADVTDQEVIRQLGIAHFDVVIISMSGHLEAEVMATMLCKEAGVEMVIAKCSEEMHRRILLRVGADRVVFPEREAGTRMAQNLISAGFLDIIELSEDLSIVELDVKPAWVGKNLVELDLRRKYEINVVALRRNDEINVHVSPEMSLSEDMSLIVIAKTSKLSKLDP